MELIRRAGVASIYLGIGRMLSYGLQILLAHMVGVKVYGEYAYSMGVVALIGVFASLGYNNSVLRFVPEYLASKELEKLKGFLLTALRFTLLGSILSALVCFSFLSLLPHGLGVVGASLFALSIPLSALIEYSSEVSRGVGDVASSIVPASIVRPIATAAVITAFYFVFRELTVIDVGITILCAGLISLSWFPGRFRSRLGQLKHVRSSDFAQDWTNTSVAMILMVGFQTLLSQSDLIIVGAQIDSTAAGYYSIASKIAVLASFPLVSVNQVFVAKISSLHSTGNILKLQRELTRASLLTFLPTLFIVVCLYLGSPFLLHMFGTRFVVAKQVLYILLLGQVVNGAAGPVGYILNLTGNHRISIKIFGTCAIVNILGCYAGARLGGTIEAVAWVGTMSLILMNAWMHVSVVKRVRVWPSILGIIAKV